MANSALTYMQVFTQKKDRHRITHCIIWKSHYYTDNAHSKSHKTTQFKTEEFKGQNERQLEKIERSHGDAVKNKIQYLHQHALQHHHPLERQLGSFHLNSSIFL